MFLAQATEKLSKTLSKYSSILKQEKLILPEKELSEKLDKCRKLIEEIEKYLGIEPFDLLKNIENILEEIHKACACTKIHEESVLPEQRTVLLKYKEKKFILSKNIPRPQINFKDRINNYAISSEGGLSIRTMQRKTASSEGTNGDGSILSEENTNCLLECLSLLHRILVSIEDGFETKNIYHITTEEACIEANTRISQESVIGVDLKKHNFRSYNGFTCYIQVCTVDGVYIFDMIALRNHSSILTFWERTDIIKVFYKREEKVEWLKKDLNYTVNSSVDLLSLCGVPESVNTLYSAIDKIGGIKIRKEFLLIDWRHKPITEEILKELVNHVKYLLYISTVLAKNTTEKQFVEMYKNISKSKRSSRSPEEFAQKYSLEVNESFLKIFLLREFVAKQEDESIYFLMTDRQLATFIKEQPTSPEEVFNLFPNISPLFKSNINNFLNLLNTKPKNASFNISLLKESSSTI